MRTPSAPLWSFATLTVALVSLGAGTAAAQQTPPSTPDVTTPTAAPAAIPEATSPPAAPVPDAPIVVAPVTPEPAHAPAPTVTASSAPPAPASVDDHTSVVGHWGVGYQGISSLPIATGSSAMPQLATVNAPVIGVRYWFGEAVGIDAGLGLGVQSGSAQPSATGFAIHAGLPIVLGKGRHSAFEVIPEATVGYTAGTIAAPAGTAGANANVGGFLIRAGARVGAEVHFGFIGLPELALQATVGLYWRTETYHLDQGGSSVDASSTLITTSVNDNPWGIFTDTIAALYYF